MSRSIQMRSATIAEKRLKLSRQETAAKQIQAYWRMALVRSRYTKLKSSIIFIQRQTRKHISNRRIAALVIQRAYRLYCVKRMREMSVSGIRNSKFNMHQDMLRFLRLRSAALYIQKSFLKRRRLKDMKNAAILIQSWWRSVIARRLFNQQRAGAVIIQSAWRSFVKLRHASVSIQSWWRCIKASRLLKKKKAAAILIQSYWQTYYAKRRFILFRRKVILVQSRWRSVKIRNSFKKKRAAALAIQSVWRSYIVKRRFKMLKCASVCIQRWWKQNSRESAIIYQNLCAVKIQAAFRSYSTKMRYFKIRKAVLLIQSIFRLKRTKRNLPQLTDEKAPVKQPIYNISKLPTLASGASKRKISNDLNTDSKRILLIPAISENSSENIENKDPDDSRKRKCKALLETAPPIKKFNRETTFTVDSNEIQEV
jgi:myosin heavy subunit